MQPASGLALYKTYSRNYEKVSYREQIARTSASIRRHEMFGHCRDVVDAAAIFLSSVLQNAKCHAKFGCYVSYRVGLGLCRRSQQFGKRRWTRPLGTGAWFIETRPPIHTLPCWFCCSSSNRIGVGRRGTFWERCPWADPEKHAHPP